MHVQPHAALGHNCDLPYDIYLSGQSGNELDVVVESNILGFHVYKDVWMPVTGEVFTALMK